MRCPGCGHSLPEGALLCTNCGQLIEDAAAPERPAARPTPRPAPTPAPPASPSFKPYTEGSRPSISTGLSAAGIGFAAVSLLLAAFPSVGMVALVPGFLGAGLTVGAVVLSEVRGQRGALPILSLVVCVVGVVLIPVVSMVVRAEPPSSDGDPEVIDTAESGGKAVGLGENGKPDPQVPDEPSTLEPEPESGTGLTEATQATDALEADAVRLSASAVWDRVNEVRGLLDALPATVERAPLDQRIDKVICDTLDRHAKKYYDSAKALCDSGNYHPARRPIESAMAVFNDPEIPALRSVNYPTSRIWGDLEDLHQKILRETDPAHRYALTGVVRTGGQVTGMVKDLLTGRTLVARLRHKVGRYTVDEISMAGGYMVLSDNLGEYTLRKMQHE